MYLSSFLKSCFFILLVFLIGFSGCAVKPDKRELQRLENARKAAESAEAQLEQLKKERLQYEEELAKQKKLLEQKKFELEDAKSNAPE